MHVGLPVLGAQRCERFAATVGGVSFGYESETVSPGGIEAATAALYARLLARVGDRHLCRIWNYVPGINGQTGRPPLEVYRAFCRARALAFEAAWGAGFAQRLPAASAVGGEPGRLVVVFALGAHAPHCIENPEQVPAYRYPAEHGPRPPSFSRAARCLDADGEWVFVSGTAAIKGHRTVAPGELAPQLACTLDNLRLVGRAAELGADLGRGERWRRQFKVYLRHASDFATARQVLERELLDPSDEVVWLHADICRAELVVEIEATLYRPQGG